MPEARGGDLEEPPQARGQGWQQGGATHTEARASGWEEQPQGVVAAQAQEGLEELSHFEGQDQRR